jgi:hypothetical protein
MALSDVFPPSTALVGLDYAAFFSLFFGGTASGGASLAVPTAGVKTLAFIDSNVTDIPLLMMSLQSDRVIVLDANKDGLQQITHVLAEYKGLTSVAILSHGVTGEVQVGGDRLNAASLGSYAHQLMQWQQSLSP